jgi:hypothetical protein
VDTVVRLRRGRQTNFRHFEFEMRCQGGFELRCFEHATRLAAHSRFPVLTTVVLVEKSGPRNGGEKYAARELAIEIPKESVMASSLWAEAVSQGRKKGRVEGAREVCLDRATQHHPAVAARLSTLIKRCSGLERLHEWALQAPELSDSAFLTLVTDQAGSASRSSGRGRTPRPSRKAKPKRST